MASEPQEEMGWEQLHLVVKLLTGVITVAINNISVLLLFNTCTSLVLGWQRK